MNTTPTFDCTFVVCVESKYAAYGVTSYTIGTRSFRSIDSLTTGLDTAFSKDLGPGRFLQVKITFTAPDGTRHGVLTKGNYEEGLSVIESMTDDVPFGLEELLDDLTDAEDPDGSGNNMNDSED